MRSLLKTNLCLVKRFVDTVRYIDDLFTLNNTKFNSEMSNIYPPELTLKRTTESDSTLSYLAVSISICRGKFVYLRFTTRKTLILTELIIHSCAVIYQQGLATYRVYIS